MVGTLTVTKSATRDGVPTELIKLDWTSNASGDVSGTTFGAAGVISRAVFVPGTAGDAPTDNYDVTLLDEQGVDILSGGGANRDTANTELVTPTWGAAAIAGTLQLVVANAGNANTGTIYITLVRAGTTLLQTPAPVVVGGDGLVHVRKTLTFTGAATLGQSASPITLFTLTGRVKVERATAYCSVDGVSGGGGTMAIGTADSVARFLAATLATNMDAGKYIASGTTAAASVKDLTSGVSASDNGIEITTNIIGTVATANITAGTVSLDFWYRPISDDGVLVGD